MNKFRRHAVFTLPSAFIGTICFCNPVSAQLSLRPPVTQRVYVGDVLYGYCITEGSQQICYPADSGSQFPPATESADPLMTATKPILAPPVYKGGDSGGGKFAGVQSPGTVGVLTSGLDYPKP